MRPCIKSTSSKLQAISQFSFSLVKDRRILCLAPIHFSWNLKDIYYVRTPYILAHYVYMHGFHLVQNQITKIGKLFRERWSIHQVMQTGRDLFKCTVWPNSLFEIKKNHWMYFARCLIQKFNIGDIFPYLKLEIALAIPASNEWKIGTSNSAAQGFNP